MLGCKGLPHDKNIAGTSLEQRMVSIRLQLNRIRHAVIAIKYKENLNEKKRQKGDDQIMWGWKKKIHLSESFQGNKVILL